ncbi:MAG: hypothetical protein NTV54_11275 [Ignavibacteriales bacterium]|nr:hypothetical protein [Ignavibacteriales bacterium]
MIVEQFERRYNPDRLRVIAFSILIFFHAGMIATRPTTAPPVIDL